MIDDQPRKYTKKPVEITALQWTRHTPMRVMREFTNNLVELDDVNEQFQVYDRLHDSWITFTYGDWIIKGIRGEFYPCQDSVFAETYQLSAHAQEGDGKVYAGPYPNSGWEPK